jgi:Mg-chelatase subunit ChlD
MRRTTWRWLSALSVAVSAAAAAIACGSSSGNGSSSGFQDGGFDATSHGDGASGHHDGGGTSPMGDAGKLGQHDSSDKRGDAAVTAPDAGCATSTSKATLVPAYIIFLMDRSDSMKQDHKFPACSAALDTFFADPSTNGISSSITFMPYFPTDAGPASCVASDYVTPQVPLTALPNGTAFATVIAAEQLKLGTPTTPALTGVIDYASTVKAAHPTDKVLIVLATDGYPAGCSPNTVGDVADAAHHSLADAGIPVYVLGVGPNTDANVGIRNLNEVAAAGGTDAAFFIPTEGDGGDGSVTTTGFLDAVHKIQGQLTCHYALPAPPQGMTLDLDKVNVVLSVADAGTTLAYSAGCASPNGWDYVNNDAGNASQVVLCASSCAEAVHAGSSASMSIVFGCTTQGGQPQ